MAQGWIAAALGAALAWPASCDLPRDPHGTRDRVAGGTLTAVQVAPVLTGAEAAALDALARSLGAELALVPGDVHTGLGALGAGEVQVLVGAIPEDTPLAEEAAATAPMGRERFVLLLRAGENALLLAANRAVRDAEAGR